jgi:hypothetical protein
VSGLAEEFLSVPLFLVERLFEFLAGNTTAAAGISQRGLFDAAMIRHNNQLCAGGAVSFKRDVFSIAINVEA